MLPPRSLLLLALAAAALPPAARAADVVTVSQQHRAFDLPGVQLAHGGVVRISNDDSFIHQVFVAPPGAYESEEQSPGTTIDVPFARSGQFEVRCHIHPKMLLRVDVR